MTQHKLNDYFQEWEYFTQRFRVGNTKLTKSGEKICRNVKTHDPFESLSIKQKISIEFNWLNLNIK